MNCKPGDLAIIVMSNRMPSIVGRIVKVVAWASRGNFEHPEAGWIDLDHDCWEIRFIGAIGALPTKRGGSRESWVAFAPDFILKPIGGAPVHNEQHDEVPA